MGSWRNRPHRRFFNRQRSPMSPPSYSFDNEPSSSDFCNDGIPLWEKKFCASVGKIPWQKIVDTHKFMYNENVLNWDDSAGKEAFQNAKERFWAHINGFACHISPPDPDIYLDEIDWSPRIDLELIKDLESVHFSPDDEAKDPKAWRRFKRLRNLAQEEYNGNSGTINTWECTNNMGVSGTLKDKAQIPNQWDNSNIAFDYNPWNGNLTLGNNVVNDKTDSWKQCNDASNNDDAKQFNNDDNPWVHSSIQGNESRKEITWENCGSKLWGRNQVADHKNFFRNCSNGGDSLKQICKENDSMEDSRGWGDSGASSQCWIQQKSWERDRVDSSWNPNFSKQIRQPKDEMGWRDRESNGWNSRGGGNGGNSWSRKQLDNQINEPKHLGSGRSSGNWGAWNGTRRKRERSHLTSHQSSGYQQDQYQTGQYWRSKSDNKRVQFCT